ncbi:MAG: LPP20 family lipoprotein [Spirochaetaceae bacterium]|jgi:hypothetical protein|nr:LPP20 family lipoprotein [Spirochaetaceae bacterium]
MLKVKNLRLITIPWILFFSCGSTPRGNSAEPAWISDPYATYDRTAYIAAVGYGPVRDTAEKAAITNLSSIFGQSITSESTANYTYTQAVEASSAAWTEESGIAQEVKTSVAMDTLIGAEIKDVWKGTDGTCYALAVMDRAKTSLIYSELIQQNLGTIAALTNLSGAEKQSLEGFINYYQAAALADANRVFANVRNVISPGSMAGENLKTGNDYRIEAGKIAKDIPIAVIVENDRQNRIGGAFAGALTSAGFRTGGKDSRYVLRASFFMEEISFLNNPYRWIRYVVDASLVDTTTGTVLFPYTVNDREGHTSIAEAENRAVRSAESLIKERYMNDLGVFLSRSKTK